MSDEMFVFDVSEIRAEPADQSTGETLRSGSAPGRMLGAPARASRDRSAHSSPGVTAHSVDTAELSGRVAGFINNVRDMLAEVSQREGAFRVEKVEVAAQINAEGKVGFMGSGVATSGGASLKIVLERRKDADPSPEEPPAAPQ